MPRQVGSLPLPPHQRARLQAAGFETTDELQGIGPCQLAEELAIPREEAMGILRMARGQEGPVNYPNALQLLVEEQAEDGLLPTFSSALDDLLGSGVELAVITELCGAPGVGKTQLCLQLAVDIQIPGCFGGLGGQAAYLDTEGSFMPERLQQMSEAVITHCSRLASTKQERDQQDALKTFTPDFILGNVFYFRCFDVTQLIAQSHLLPDFVDSHPKVRLVIIDSVASPFRHGVDDAALRTRLLISLAQRLAQLASTRRLAVVLTNQMTTRIHPNSTQSASLTPALGESWGHAATHRVILQWQGNRRFANLIKSPTRGEATVEFTVTSEGIRDVPTTPSLPATMPAIPTASMFLSSPTIPTSLPSTSTSSNLILKSPSALPSLHMTSASMPPSTSASPAVLGCTAGAISIAGEKRMRNMDD
uniref:DNA repair protein RAD51 homolog 3 n=1 Tax=Eptatretus burgeri TaxID=7764 RepID=A0A8C4RA12_EPTBU